MTFCAARVSDVSKDVAAMRKYLMNDLGFKEDVANALLDSSYSVRVVSQSNSGRENGKMNGNKGENSILTHSRFVFSLCMSTVL